MISWIIASLLGLAVAWLAYGRARAPFSPANLGLALLRAVAVAFVAALALGAPLGPPSPAPPILALDASASLRRTHDSTNARTRLRAFANDVMQREGADQVITFGDSLREGDAALIGDATWNDSRSTLRTVVDRAAALGRPLVIVTDGEVDDVAAFDEAPAGSRVAIDTLGEREDAAIAELTVTASGAAGDTMPIDIVVVAGGGGSPGGQLRLLADGTVTTTTTFPALEAYATTRVTSRLMLPRAQRMVLLQAVLAATSDHEVRNDTLGTFIEVSDRPPVVFVSTAPDLDVRAVLGVLRGALDLPVRSYLRIAPQLWREEGSLAAVSEADVRTRAQSAGLVIVHGDTAWGGVHASARGARALWSPAPPPPAARAGEIQRDAEWYPSSAPMSPLAAALSGLPWDTLPPFRLAGPAQGDFAILEARLARSGTPVAAVAGRDRNGTRTVVVSGTGYAGWSLRGGRPAEAFTALWGAIFDWLAAARGDERAARPVVAQLRAGEPVRWRRGGADSVVSVVLTRRGTVGADTITLRFAAGGMEAVSPSLEQGVYDVQTSGGTSMMVVNASRELLPRQPTLRADARIAGTVTNDAPSLADRGWPFVLALLLLCAEWVGRRFAGLR